MKPLLLLLLLLLSSPLFAQQEITGIVTDNYGIPVTGANIYIKGTYSGATSDATGRFSFTTRETGVQVLIVSFVSFETLELELPVSQMSNLRI